METEKFSSKVLQILQEIKLVQFICNLPSQRNWILRSQLLLSGHISILCTRHQETLCSISAWHILKKQHQHQCQRWLYYFVSGWFRGWCAACLNTKNFFLKNENCNEIRKEKKLATPTPPGSATKHSYLCVKCTKYLKQFSHFICTNFCCL